MLSACILFKYIYLFIYLFTSQDTETNFYSLASLFFHERSAQQLQQLQKPLKEYD